MRTSVIELVSEWFKRHERQSETYHVVAVVTELLAHELIHPLGGLVVATAGLHSGDYERHVGLDVCMRTV